MRLVYAIALVASFGFVQHHLHIIGEHGGGALSAVMAVAWLAMGAYWLWEVFRG